MANGSRAPRVAICGLHLEANAFAPVTVRADFERLCWAEGEDISQMARRTSVLPSEVPGFYARMDETGPWEAVPAIVAAAPPGGPIDQPVFDAFLAVLEARLRAVLPVDAVYVPNHGASAATDDDDSDGTMLSLVRRIVGADVPIVVTHDLHCNVSERPIEACDALIAYRTNPHVDMRERAAEAADLLREMLAGIRTGQAFIRLPLVAPSLTQLSSVGRLGDLIRHATARIGGAVANVSVTSGFAHADLPKCGMTINVTTRNDPDLARRVAAEVASHAWSERGRYVTHMLRLDDTVEKALAAPEPIILADVADNPGGGAGGNSCFVLRALHAARVPGAALGNFVDRRLAEEVHALGEGASFRAVFNRVEGEHAERFEAQAQVVKLTDGKGVGRRGTMVDREFDLGPSALLRLERSGILVVVASLRRQLNEPMMMEMHGVDLASLRCLVVKSRGHFRAAFDEFFAPAHIFEVDVPGLVTPNIMQLAMKKLPRPVAPWDADAAWTAPAP